MRLNHLPQMHGVKATILAKLEFFNPIGSVKDRIGVAMIDAMEAKGAIGPDTVIVEPTSGNTGIALAFVAAARLQADPGDAGFHVAGAAQDAAPAWRAARPDAGGAGHARRHRAGGRTGARQQERGMPQQFSNPANPEIHRRTTAEEIWNDTQGAVDVFVSGVGTGGTITGVGQVLKPRKKSLRVVAVEPEDSAVLSGKPAGRTRFRASAPVSFPTSSTARSSTKS